MDILRCPNCEAPYEARDIDGRRAACQYCGAVTTLDETRGSAREEEQPVRRERRGFHDDLQSHPVGTVRIVKALLLQCRQQRGIDLTKDTTALKRLLDAARKASAELEHAPETEINLPFIAADGNGPVHLNLKVTRAFLEMDRR